jgi:hypothetical protein
MNKPNGDSPPDDINEKLLTLIESQQKNWDDHDRIWQAIEQLQVSTANLKTAVSETNKQIGSLVGAIRDLIERIPPENLR